LITIASLFDIESDSKTREIWDILEYYCNLFEIKTLPNPHLSWQSAKTYAIQSLDDRLKDFTNSINPILLRTSGLGIFTGKSPILYLPIVKTNELIKIHKNLWERLRDLSVIPNQFYSPDNWIPHITIAYGDVTVEKISCAIRQLGDLNYEISILIDNITVLHRDDDVARIGNFYYFY